MTSPKHKLLKMPPLLAKFYNLDENSYEPVKRKGVLSLTDIISFVESVAKEDMRTWIMLESARIEESLKKIGANGWLKVAIQFDPVSSHLKDAGKRFIILTQRADEPCALPENEYNGFTVSGTHSSHKYLWNLWCCFVLVPYVLLQFVGYSCCCNNEDLNPIRKFTKQYKEIYRGMSMV
jgi:hypothetical protein